MCTADATTMAQLETTVRQFLEEGRMFTAYDVTIETRNREKLRLRHQDIPGACHEIQILRDAVDFGYDAPSGQTVQWQKTNRPMPQGQWSFVYHPASLDPASYQPRNVGAPAAQPAVPPSQTTASTAAPSVPTISAVPTDSGGKNDDGTYSPDYQKRLLVPTQFVREAGINAGDDAHLVKWQRHTQPVLCLVADPVPFQSDPTYQIINKKRVERNGHVRIRRENMTGASLNVDRYNITNQDYDVNGIKLRVVEITAG